MATSQQAEVRVGQRDERKKRERLATLSSDPAGFRSNRGTHRAPACGAVRARRSNPVRRSGIGVRSSGRSRRPKRQQPDRARSTLGQEDRFLTLVPPPEEIQLKEI